MPKAKYISFKQITLFTIAVFYTTICFLLNLEQSVAKYQSYVEAINSLKNDSETIVLDEFKLNSEDYLYSLKQHKVVADTLVYGLHSDNKGTYLIAGITNSNDQRILLKLSVDAETIKNYSKITYRRALLSAQIKDVLKLPYHKEVCSFDNQVVWENTKYDIMLEGRLDELLYITAVLS